MKYTWAHVVSPHNSVSKTFEYQQTEISKEKVLSFIIELENFSNYNELLEDVAADKCVVPCIINILGGQIIIEAKEDKQ